MFCGTSQWAECDEYQDCDVFHVAMVTNKKGPEMGPFKQKGPRNGALFAQISCFLERDDVLCLRAFLALGYGELDLLAFSERLEAVALDCAEMRKHIRAVFLLDKAKAF